MAGLAALVGADLDTLATETGSFTIGRWPNCSSCARTLLAFEQENRAYFAASVPDRGDASAGVLASSRGSD
jgi:hypothetical protein